MDVPVPEMLRRTRVANRIDEFLSDAEKLDDFAYTDDDLESLKK